MNRFLLLPLCAAAALTAGCGHEAAQHDAIASALRAPAYPLVTIDPYTSAWSMTDNLYDGPVKHWTGKDFPLIGVLKVDGIPYRFMGTEEVEMTPVGDRMKVEFLVPARGLFGYRNQFLTDTHGEGIINQIFDGYDVWAGMIANRSTGSLVSFETGEAVTYGLFNAQQRGTLLVGAGEKVYEGMVIGYTASGEDVDVNVCKTKHLTNTRSSGSDDALRLIPISKLSLEGCLEFLAQDELLEVTPENLRIRKQILNHEQRMKAKSKLK